MQPRTLVSVTLALGVFAAACSQDDGTAGTDTLPVAPGVAGSSARTVSTGIAGGLSAAAGGAPIGGPPPAGSRGAAGTGSMAPPAVGTPAPGRMPGSGSMAMPPGPGSATSAAPTTPLPSGGMRPTMLPAVKGACPTLATGPIMVNNVMLQAWVGQKKDPGGPMIIYWHGTGGNASTAMAELDRTLVSETLGLGGLIVSMESGQQGNPIDWGVFTTGDFEIVDQAVACAIEQLNIDASRIYTSGASAGGLAAGTMAYARSNYLAGSFPNSGGVAPWPGLNVFQNSAQIPAVFAMHGAKGKDTVVIEFADSSLQLCNDTAAKGGFAVCCDHGGGHVAAPADLKAAAWTFMKAHPFGTKPSPYAGGLPAGFPMYCKIIGK